MDPRLVNEFLNAMDEMHRDFQLMEETGWENVTAAQAASLRCRGTIGSLKYIERDFDGLDSSVEKLLPTLPEAAEMLKKRMPDRADAWDVDILKSLLDQHKEAIKTYKQASSIKAHLEMTGPDRKQKKEQARILIRTTMDQILITMFPEPGFWIPMLEYYIASIGPDRTPTWTTPFQTGVRNLFVAYIYFIRRGYTDRAVHGETKMGMATIENVTWSQLGRVIESKQKRPLSRLFLDKSDPKRLNDITHSICTLVKFAITTAHLESLVERTPAGPVVYEPFTADESVKIQGYLITAVQHIGLNREYERHHGRYDIVGLKDCPITEPVDKLEDESTLG